MRTKSQIQFLLLEWFALHARVLPWRDAAAGSRGAYRTWLSEVLLQQMQVARAVAYFERFLVAFPTVQDLAVAPLDLVLKVWEGAGYYARARNLHLAAQIMASSGIPSSSLAWQQLPGVGRYTAAAIASLTTNEAVAAVDGNVRRVLARLENELTPTEDWLWATATAWLEPGRAGAWNEALIELGATVCKPKKPLCSVCPISIGCQALAAGSVLVVPAAKPKPKVRLIRAVALILHHQGRVYLELRPKTGLLGGLYGLPLAPVVSTPEAALAGLLERYVASPATFLGTVLHVMTHRRFEIQVFAVPSARDDLLLPSARAISVLDAKMLGLLESGGFVTPT